MSNGAISGSWFYHIDVYYTRSVADHWKCSSYRAKSTLHNVKFALSCLRTALTCWDTPPRNSEGDLWELSLDTVGRCPILTSHERHIGLGCAGSDGQTKPCVCQFVIFVVWLGPLSHLEVGGTDLPGGALLTLPKYFNGCYLHWQYH